jgi:peptidoglycan/xylan/chitin deacetylase (PgdA/CDA1 family)
VRGYIEREIEVREGEAAIRSAGGVTTRPYFRPPYGDFDRCTLRQLRSDGYRYNVMWSTDSLGASGASAAEIDRRVLAGLRPGAIYLFHVGSGSQDAAALPTIIMQLRSRGYRFTTLVGYLP